MLRAETDHPFGNPITQRSDKPTLRGTQSDTDSLDPETILENFNEVNQFVVRLPSSAAKNADAPLNISFALHNSTFSRLKRRTS